MIRFDFVDKSNPICVRSTPVYSQAVLGSIKEGDIVDLTDFTVIEKDCCDDKKRLYLIPKTETETSR